LAFEGIKHHMRVQMGLQALSW